MMSENDKVELTEAQFKVLSLVQSGAKPEDIAKTVQLTKEQVLEELATALALKHPDSDSFTALELQRLDTLNRAAWTKAVTGDLDAVRVALSVSQRRVALKDREAAQCRSLTPAQELQNSMDELLRHTIASNVSNS